MPPVPLELLLMPLVSQSCTCMHFYPMIPMSLHLPYALVRIKFEHELTIPQLSCICMSNIPYICYWFMNILFLRVLPNYPTLSCTSFWLMGDALMPSFYWIPFHSRHIIYFGIGIQSPLSSLRLVVINGRFSPHRKIWEYINVP